MKANNGGGGISSTSSKASQSSIDVFVEDFISLLSKGLFVFVRISGNAGNGGGTKLMILSYESFTTQSEEGVDYCGGNSGENIAPSFVISSVDNGEDSVDVDQLLPINFISFISPKGTQGITIECSSSSGSFVEDYGGGDACNNDMMIVEIITSDEGDREVLIDGLTRIVERERGVKEGEMEIEDLQDEEWIEGRER